MKDKVIFIVGPTAVGKTEVAAHLAKKINGEIISCDSMQIYKGMDIITSKPPRALRKAIPHHLIDLVSPEKVYNVSAYRCQAVKIIKEVLKKEKTPILVGGTGLYMTILLDGIFKEGSKNNTIRQGLYKELELGGSIKLYNKLKKVDPEAAAKIHPNDARRIIRAYEVYLVTGKPISLLQKQRRGIASEYDVKIFCLNIERSKLCKRIDNRVDFMFKQGLVPEVKRLLKRKLSKTASFAIGLREIKGYIDGVYDMGEAARLIKCNTRAFAKRQLTWFRKDRRIKWIQVKEKEKPQAIAGKIWKELYL